MSRRRERYGWASYYAAAYETERKQNIVLAGKIADAQRRQRDLSDNLDRICSSPFWKAAAPFRKIYHNVRNAAPRRKSTDRCSAENPCLLRYEEELKRQKSPYAEWIREENINCYITDVSKDAGVIEGWQAIRVPESEIVLLTYGKGMLAGNAFEKVKSIFDKTPSCKAAYGDEDFYWEDLSCRMHPWFKPCYSPDTMLAFNYWGHLVAVKASLLAEVLSGEEVKNRKERMKHPVRFYDLCLRLEELIQRRCLLEGVSMQQSICHVDGILYHQAYEPSEVCREEIEACKTREERFDQAAECLEREMENGRYLTGAGADCVSVREMALVRRGIKGSLESGQNPDLYHVVYDTSISGAERCARALGMQRHVSPNYVVSVVIPSRDHPEILERCLKSFRDKTAYRYYEWIVVDNGSNAENRAAMEELSRKYGFRYIYEEMPFNFSKMCNLGARQAEGDLLLFMNDDMEIIEKSWLERMAGQALQPETGAVGAKLWYAGTQKIQHAGITNMQIGPSHKLVTFPDDRDYYYGHNEVVCDMIGVTGACLMVSRAKYEQAGGFDEEMAVSYNDVDFCFRLAEAGYYNVQRNDAVLYHHESLSRGLDEQDEDKWERLLAEKEKLYTKHPGMRGTDPFYHRALIDNASHYGCNYKFDHEKQLHTMEVCPIPEEILKKADSRLLKLTVDRAEIQHKIHADEPDILWVMGWCYIPGIDNGSYAKHIVLNRAEGESYTAVPADWHRQDVEAILPGECNVGLAGFVLRVLVKDLKLGTYRIGMLCTTGEQVGQGESFFAWSDKSCKIAGDGSCSADFV